MSPSPRRTTTTLTLATALALTACTGSGPAGSGGPGKKPSPAAAVTTVDSADAITGSAADQAIGASKAAFDSAQAAVVVTSSDSTDAVRGASIGQAMGVPVLVAASNDDAVAAEIKRLGAKYVLVVGTAPLTGADGVKQFAAPASAKELAAATGLDVTGKPIPDNASIADLRDLGDTEMFEVETTETSSGEGLTALKKNALRLAPTERGDGTVALVDADDDAVAAAGSLLAAGADLHVTEGDFRTDEDALDAVSGSSAVFAVGADLPDSADFQWQVSVAQSGEDLPGGGQLMFDGKRYVALYGSPVTSLLGALGEQGPDETVKRAADMAADYQKLTDDTVIPALEIIVTVASGKPGDDGNYSNEWDIDTFMPLITAAEEAGQYVVIDFQPGRADFLTQVKQYEELLKHPHVGIALDPEWRLGPNERPLSRIGHVEIDEVNEVIDYVADFVRDNNLPEKVVVLHQFQLQMLRDRDQVNTSRSQVEVLIHADGQGTQPMKNETWTALHKDAPEGVHWGWKNFIDEDHPMLTPEQTYQIEPKPDFVSYQ